MGGSFSSPLPAHGQSPPLGGQAEGSPGSRVQGRQHVPTPLPARGLPSKAPPHQAGATKPSAGHCEGETGCRRGFKHPPTLTHLLFLQHLEHFEEQEGQETINLCQSGGSFQLQFCQAQGGHRLGPHSPTEPQTAGASPSLHSHCSLASTSEQTAAQALRWPGTPPNRAPQPLQSHSKGGAREGGALPSCSCSKQSTSTQICGLAEVLRERRWGQPHLGSQSMQPPQSTLGFALCVEEIGVQSPSPLNL